jgi:hypothetical protein
VYDLERDRAHCLNRTAALVWQHCDGQTTVADLARLLKDSINLPADEGVVWMALERLGKANLLEERISPPGGAGRHTRRDVLRRLGLAAGLAILLPAVQSIVAPEAVQAASGVTSQQCRDDFANSEGKCCTNVSPNRICVRLLWLNRGVCWGANC